MNDRNEMIDRLLERKLSDQERKDFLARLDQEDSDGWRSLALGFVEQQVMTEALRKWQEKEMAKVVPEYKKLGVSLRWIGGIAAALALGLFLGNISSGPTNDDELRVKTVPPVELPENESDPVLEQVTHSLDELKGNLDAIGYDSQIKGGYLEASLRDGRQIIVPISHVATKRR